MKKVKSNKLSLNKQTVSNLNDVKGGGAGHSQVGPFTGTGPVRRYTCKGCDLTISATLAGC